LSGAVVVAEFPFDFDRVLHLANQFPGFIFPCLGLHPVQVLEYKQLVLTIGIILPGRSFVSNGRIVQK
jgi:Tat protein secretion system quality control protein TatD with DNase activity